MEFKEADIALIKGVIYDCIRDAPIIDKKIDDALTRFRKSTLLGEQGICRMQHQNIHLVVTNALQEELKKWKDSLTIRIVVGTVVIVICDVIMRLFFNR